MGGSGREPDLYFFFFFGYDFSFFFCVRTGLHVLVNVWGVYGIASSWFDSIQSC
jgi:hypothetical protein